MRSLLATEALRTSRYSTTRLNRKARRSSREPSGKACNSWELWAADLDLVAGLGLTAYRFSVEWARVEPADGYVDEDALAHYEAIVDGCHQRGLAPIVTFSHFTSPHWFAARGGWLDPQAPQRFARYVDRVMERFGKLFDLAGSG